MKNRTQRYTSRVQNEHFLSTKYVQKFTNLTSNFNVFVIGAVLLRYRDNTVYYGSIPECNVTRSVVISMEDDRQKCHICVKMCHNLVPVCTALLVLP